MICSANSSSITSVSAYYRPADYRSNLYQKYYRKSVASYLGTKKFRRISVSKFTGINFALGKMGDSYKLGKILGRHILNKLINMGAKLLEGQLETASGKYCSGVGQYVFELVGKKLRVCIDTSDSGNISSEELLVWCDIYFKSNYWEDRRYDPKVIPIYNLNPFVLEGSKYLRSLRNIDKRFDLCFIVRVWGGRDEIEGIEHNLRMLEEISKINCNKFIYAYLVSGEIDEYTRRLGNANIFTAKKGLPLKKLWDISGRSEIVIIRLGMHYCMPWRMTDIMCMGAVPVFDRRPFTIWPANVVEGTNYYSLNLNIGEGKPVAAREDYGNIKDEVIRILEDRKKLEEIRKNNWKYFDSYLDPYEVGNYISGIVMGKEWESASKAWSAKSSVFGSNQLAGSDQ